MRNSSLTLLLLFFFSCAALAAEKVITLKDGSRINGEIVGMKNGNYVIKSSFGEFTVPEESMISMTAGGTPATPAATQPPTPATGNAYSGQMQAMQTQIMSDPKIVADIQAMAQDPDLMAAMADPAFVQAIQTQNFQAIESSPQFQRLLNNPSMRALMGKIHSGQQQ